MSDVAVTWAKAQDCPTRPSKPLLAFLASYANAAGEGWAAVEVLAIELQVDDRSVRRGLKELREAKLLEDTGKWEVYQGKRYPIFRLPLERGFANTAQKMRAMREAARAAMTPVSPQADACHDATVTPAGGENDSSVTPRPDSSVTQIGKGTGKGSSDELPAGARDADEAFEALFAAYPESGQVRTHRPAARAIFRPIFAEIGREAAVVMARRYAAEDRDLKRGDYGAPALETWLEGERWRKWLPVAGSVQPAITRTPFVGPETLLADIAAALPGGRSRADALLDGATWREADRTVLTRTDHGARLLRQEIPWRSLKALDLHFERAAPAPAASHEG